jgi:hypothetical protein
LIADDADRMPVEPGEPTDDVLRVILHHLEKPAVVDDAGDHVAHVIRLIRIVGDDRLQLRVLAMRVVEGRPVRRLFPVVRRQV